MTIIVYSDTRPHEQNWPRRIVSPTRASACCFLSMENVGAEHTEGQWIMQYRRCAVCGFAVRKIVREVPDAALLRDLAATFSRQIVRGW